MKRYLSYLLFALLLSALWAETAWAGTPLPAGPRKIIFGYVYVNGVKTPAEYIELPDGTLGLGSGQNACVSQYSEGRLVVPAEITGTVLELEYKYNPKNNFTSIVFPIVNNEKKTYRVTQVMDMAFRLCNRLTYVELPEGVTAIGNFAFVGCTAITDVNLPSTLKTIGSGAFVSLRNLELMVCKATTPPEWEYNDVFFFHEGGISDSQTYAYRQRVFLSVPKGSEEAYMQALYHNDQLGWTTPEGWGSCFSNINGSALENFHLNEPEDVEMLRRYVNEPEKFGEVKNVWLERDISMSIPEIGGNTVWKTPIGATAKNPCRANIHGQGHSISGLTVENDNAASLFGYFAGDTIVGLTVGGDYKSKQLAGGLCAVVSSDCIIEQCYIQSDVHSDHFAGAMIGTNTGTLTVRDCVMEGNMVEQLSSGSTPQWSLMIANAQASTTIRRAAIINRYNIDSGIDPFVGSSKSDVTIDIDSCYVAATSLSGYQPKSQFHIGDCIAIYGHPMTYVDESGVSINSRYDIGTMQSFYLASVLGIDHWVYSAGRYPMPTCFEHLWPVETNRAVYRPASLTTERTNGLSPAEPIPAKAWCDRSNKGFRSYRFNTSRLAIDIHLSLQEGFNDIPLGMSAGITAEHGIQLDSALCATSKGLQPVMQTIYKADKDNVPLFDADGNPIPDHEVVVDSIETFKPVGYAVCLPYNVTLGPNCDLYQPAYIHEGVQDTVCVFERVRDNQLQAFKPYYVVVREERFTLGTDEKTFCPRMENNAVQLGNYELQGNIGWLWEATIHQYNYYVLNGDQWTNVSLPRGTGRPLMLPFSCYFKPLDRKRASHLGMALEGEDIPLRSGDYDYLIDTSSDNHQATMTHYYGTGGNIKVPASVVTTLGGTERQAPVVGIGPKVYTALAQSDKAKKDDIWSIDLTDCTELKPLTVNRQEPGNPFYGVDTRTIIYLPEGKAPAADNVVVGTECQLLNITDGWDFCAPYDFHAGHVRNSRTLSASKQKDGTYKSYAYSICLPYVSDDLEETRASGQVKVYRLYSITHNNEFIFSHTPEMFPGEAYLVEVMQGTVSLNANDVDIQSQPSEGEEIWYYNEEAVFGGYWRGTFRAISNDEAAEMLAYVSQSGKTFKRIRNDEARYQTATIGAFRAFYAAQEFSGVNTYQDVFKKSMAGEGDEEENPTLPFSADDTYGDADMSFYDETEPSGITTVHQDSNSTPDSLYDLQGRRIERKPGKGVYIHQGKKIVVK